MEIIQTNSINKYFGKTLAIDNISIQVNKGEIFGFLGLNGAGKTTLIRIILGMIKQNKGEVKLFGQNLNSKFQHWNDIGYLVETPYSYPNLTIVENLKVYYKLRNLKDSKLIEEIIHKLHLDKYKDKKAKVLSLGNKQRLGLAKALMHKPKLLILDEPINGLDPEGIKEIRNLLKELSENGVTIFLSSHILEEISKIANRIGIINNGKLIKQLTNKELSNQIIKKLIINTNDNKKAIKILNKFSYKSQINDNNELEINNNEAIKYPEKISKILVNEELPPKKIYEYQEDLEMFFLRMVQENKNE